MTTLDTLSIEEWDILSTDEWVGMLLQLESDDFVTDLSRRRGNPRVGGNPIRFIELAGGREILYQFWEPDPVTTRESYYYNTRTNVLFKRIELGSTEKKFVWKNILCNSC